MTGKKEIVALHVFQVLEGAVIYSPPAIISLYSSNTDHQLSYKNKQATSFPNRFLLLMENLRSLQTILCTT